MARILETQMESCWSNPLAVKFLRRLEGLGLPNCPTPKIRNELLRTAHAVIQRTINTYETLKENPPLAINMPPISGEFISD